MDIAPFAEVASGLGGIIIGSFATAFTMGKRYGDWTRLVKELHQRVGLLEEDYKSFKSKSAIEREGLADIIATVKNTLIQCQTQIAGHLTQKDISIILDRLGHIEGMIERNGKR